jgi:hypothetical protein
VLVKDELWKECSDEMKVSAAVCHASATREGNLLPDNYTARRALLSADIR